ncbi:MAG: hypothetical protein JWN90_123, partial [Parcubacteria group bacterium]|nr:hypothetical protein [Parcubacteria group bacterium]
MADEVDPNERPENERKDLRPMDPSESLKIDVLSWGVPGLVLSVIGAVIGSQFGLGIGTAIMLLLIWSAGFWAAGFMVVTEAWFVVIERFGQFHSVKFPGWRWKNPFFDYERLRDCMSARPFELYKAGDKKAVIDFLDASAPITALSWYSIGNPVDVANKDWDLVTPQIALWTYRYIDPRKRAASIFDGSLRPKLQALTIDQAQVGGDAAAEAAVAEARPSLAGFGAYPTMSGKALIIDDINLPPEVVAQRQRKLAGEKAADEETAKFQGPARAANAIVTAAKALGHTVTYKEAMAQVLQQMAFDTLRNTGANVTLVGQDLPGVTK